MINVFFDPDFVEDPLHFIFDPGRDKRGNTPAHNLILSVSIYFLSALIPTRNDSLQCLADDGILRRLNNSGKLVGLLLRPVPFCDVITYARSPDSISRRIAEHSVVPLNGQQLPLFGQHLTLMVSRKRRQCKRRGAGILLRSSLFGYECLKPVFIDDFFPAPACQSEQIVVTKGDVPVVVQSQSDQIDVLEHLTEAAF